MILHKENTLRAEPFYKSIDELSLYKNEEVGLKEYGTNELKMLEKYSYFIQNLISFEQDIKDESHTKILMAKFLRYLKGIIPVKEFSMLFFDEFQKELIPIDEEDGSRIAMNMNHFYKEGIFKDIFSDRRTINVPDLESYNSEGSKLFYLIIPIYDDKKNYGILSLLTSLDQNSITELEKKSIDLYLNLILGRLEKLKLTEKLNETYEELQTYQAKLSNDFRLSAIGEMTEGIVEDIVTPLQVISSNVDLLKSETDKKIEVTQIKSQIKKINNVINRLVKFADVNQKDVKIQPCNINSIINDYFFLVKSTLENANLEYILDFESDLPSILSHPNYIYQLLTNIFSLIKRNKVKKGGVIIQTRFKDNNVILRVISTNQINTTETKDNTNIQQNLSVSIIKNLMRKHEGQLELGSFENSGAALVMVFPLKRKIRK
jgi:hypothetical protein